MSKVIDLTDQFFDKLYVLCRNGTSKSGEARWLCQCECGELTTVNSSDLRKSKQKNLPISCRCHRNRRQGRSHTSSYIVWHSMIQRCYQSNYAGYARYGGRGITVCERWLGEDGYDNFIADMGEPPAGLSIDRFPDPDGNYEPSNCRWATLQEQAINRHTTRWIEFDGRKQTLTAWADELGIAVQTLASRLDKWPLERALTEPKKGKEK